MTEGSVAAGSVAGFGPRLLAFLVDAVVCDLLALFSGRRPGDPVYGYIVLLAFLLIEFLFVGLAGQTPGMRVVGIAVVRASDGGRAALRWVLARTVLLAFVVPALWPDGSGRPLHDRAAGTSTIRVR
ncbi:MAG: hypothetical protein QOD07_413 [Frankiaceae bacterium]|jgi:uncharacterized RDD family membrane protein YckC|nr:hypothetical protein [Frankiaceae bacterium]